MMEEIHRESEALEKLDHRNVITLIKSFAMKKEVIMCMEFCAGGELYDFVNQRGTVDELTARRIFEQIANGMSYVHKRGIVHRDLKLENVMFKNPPPDLTIKILDFGISGCSQPDRAEKSNAGSLNYMPPEVITQENTEADAAIDIWALGCILYAMVMGKLPFYGNTHDEIEDAIVNSVPRFRIKFDFGGEIKPAPTLSKEIKDLILGCLKKDPNERLGIFDILMHPWLEMDDGELEASIEESKAKQDLEEQMEQEREEKR